VFFLNLKHYAVAAPTAKRKTMVDMLIKKGGDVNSGNRDGITPLHIAAEKSHLDVLEMLLKVGAQVGRYLYSTHTRYKCRHNKVLNTAGGHNRQSWPNAATLQCTCWSHAKLQDVDLCRC
jgi:ankyrin repeat protein